MSNKKPINSKRIKGEALDLIVSGKTLRQLADTWGVSKSQVHRDLRFLLPRISVSLAIEVNDIIEEHKHTLRGRHVKP